MSRLFDGFVRVIVKVCSVAVPPVTEEGRPQIATDGVGVTTNVTAAEVLPLNPLPPEYTAVSRLVPAGRPCGYINVTVRLVTGTVR